MDSSAPTVLTEPGQLCGYRQTSVRPEALWEGQRKHLDQPVRSLEVPVQFPDCLAGLESVGPKFLQVQCSAQVQRREDEEVRLDKTSESQPVEEERRCVDWGNDSCLVSHPDESKTAPLVLSGPQAGRPTPNDQPVKGKGPQY